MTTDRYEQIQIWQDWLANHGLPSFPLFGITNGACRCPTPDCRTPGKHPKVKGWRHVPADEYVPAGPLDNVGVSTDRLVVVDIDAGDIPADLPETFTVATGRGYHLWYLANPDKRVGNATGWRPKIDIRSVGGLVAAPPSRHATGTVYEYVGGEFTPVPQMILDSLNERQERALRPQVTEVPDDTPDWTRPLVDALVRQVLDAPNGQRNDSFFKVMCRYFELADKGWAGADALRDLHGAALQAGLGEHETLAVIESASRSLTG